MRTPDWLSDDAIERTYALGREIAIFLQRRDGLKALAPNAKVEPHQQLLELIAKLGDDRRDRPSKQENMDHA
jgi:hypothetical protein